MATRSRKSDQAAGNKKIENWGKKGGDKKIEVGDDSSSCGASESTSASNETQMGVVHFFVPDQAGSQAKEEEKD